MREFFSVILIIAAIGVAATALHNEEAQRLTPPPAPKTDIVPHETFVIFKQDRRTIYVKRAAISGFATFPDGFDQRGRPVVNVWMGAKEFRFDVQSKDDIDDIVDAFIGDKE